MFVFFYDELQTRDVQEKMKLPLHFISFGKIEGYKMYTHKKRLTIVPKDFGTSFKDSPSIYGTIWKLEEPTFYIRLLDAYYGCSKSRIYENHPFDFRHRLALETYPFSINSIDDLQQHRFYESNPIRCYTWIANTNDSKLEKRVKKGNYRVTCGCKLEYLEENIERM